MRRYVSVASYKVAKVYDHSQICSCFALRMRTRSRERPRVCVCVCAAVLVNRVISRTKIFLILSHFAGEIIWEIDDEEGIGLLACSKTA